MIKTKQQRLFQAAQGGPNAKTLPGDLIGIGTVVDTNDPMQWGRIRAVVPAWGDRWDEKVGNMPWALYVTPFGGQTSTGTRGAGLDVTEGSVSYGMWAIPNVGAQVVIMSLDKDHEQRLFMGCLYDAHSTHTMPHGRWTYEDHPALDDEKPPSKPYGPYSSGDKLIQPLAGNIAKAFGKSDNNLEKQSRVGDYSVSRVDVSQLSHTQTNVQDDDQVQHELGWIQTNGYQSSRVSLENNSGLKKNYDSHIYSLTSPGFHSMSMDDRMENCRVRLRTTSGHQILLDDTNERIYISTAQGNNWVEMDQAGNIDIFSANKISIHSAADINMTSDASIRMYAKTGIHMHSDADVRVDSKANVQVNTKTAVKITAGKEIHIKAGGDLKLTTNKTTHIKSGKQMLMSAPDIYQNGPPADKADKAELAFYTSRVPNHEPWARVSSKKDDSHEGEFKYDDPKVGRIDQGIKVPRGIYWRR